MAERTADMAVIADVAKQAGVLGVEIADVAGHVDDVSARVKAQADLFKDLRAAAVELSASNEKIAAVAGEAAAVAGTASKEMDASRVKVNESLGEIGKLVEVASGFARDIDGLREALEREQARARKLEEVNAAARDRISWALDTLQNILEAKR